MGAIALAAGRRLGPADLGLAAALGHDELPVFRRLRVALLSTGDEVREPGATLPPGAIYDANRFMLQALLEGLGCAVTDFGIRPDREAALADTLAAASAEHDLIVTSGGVSTGEEDHVKGAIERLGRAPFLAAGDQAGPAGGARPGRRRAADRAARQPGRGGRDLRRPRPAADPASSPAPRPRRRGCSRCAPASPIAKSPGGANICARGSSATATRVVAVKYARDGAGILSSIVHSDGLVILDEATSDLAAGAIVDFLPFAEVLG